jgi:hypothetical protein
LVVSQGNQANRASLEDPAIQGTRATEARAEVEELVEQEEAEEVEHTEGMEQTGEAEVMVENAALVLLELQLDRLVLI